MANPDEKWPTASFEEKYGMLMGKMSEADQKRSEEQLRYLCLCSKCPTNSKAGETNAIFCNKGKREVILEQKGCLCPECGVTRTMSLRWDYYCNRGSAVELSDL